MFGVTTRPRMYDSSDPMRDSDTGFVVSVSAEGRVTIVEPFGFLAEDVMERPEFYLFGFERPFLDAFESLAPGIYTLLGLTYDENNSEEPWSYYDIIDGTR